MRLQWSIRFCLEIHLSLSAIQVKNLQLTACDISALIGHAPGR